MVSFGRRRSAAAARTPTVLVVAAVLAAQGASAITCTNYGNTTSSGSSCLCPPGFNPSGGSSSADCSVAACGGSLYSPGAPASLGATGYGNISSSSCACSSGWAGPACTVCQTASGCSASLSKYVNSSTSLGSTALNTSMTCSTIPTVYAESQMSCNVIQQTLQSLFPGESTLTITRSLNTSRTPGGASALTAAGLASGDGVVWAQLWYNGTEQFYCRANGCQQTVKSTGGSFNESTWDCPQLSCTCRPGTEFCGAPYLSASHNLTQVINSLAGPLVIDCATSSNCAFKQNFLNSLFGSGGLQLSSCSHGECVQQYVVDQALGIETAAPVGTPPLSGGVIGGLAVVGALILALIALIIWGFVERSKARKNMRTDGVLPRSGGVGLVWSGLGYEVASQGLGAGTKVAAWIKGSGGGMSRKNEEGAAVGPHGGRVVLRDSCGQLPPGGFCAILGPSGAGKSTLVDILAGKRKRGHVEGKVGFTRDRGADRVKIGYVDQADVLSPTSTVLETLIFAASLRLPENIPQSVKVERAKTVLGQLGLTDIAHTRIGSGERRGISGGEMRRVSIGVELVAAPDVLVLDEPTSGLDSVSAARLIKLLKNLAEEERVTIIASIHQPSSALYQSFNQVVLLANGRQLYFGLGGHAPAGYFAEHGRPCPADYNVADHLLEIASGSPEGLPSGAAAMLAVSGGAHASGNSENVKTAERHSAHSSTESDAYRSPSQNPLLRATSFETPATEKQPMYPPNIHTLFREEFGSPNGENGNLDLAALGDDGGKSKGWWPKSHCATTFLTQIEVLSGREWRNLKRDKTLLVAHILLAGILGVFAGGLYFKVNLTIAGFQNRVGSLFFLGSLIAFSSLSALYNLVEVRSLFLRERAGNFYSPQAWLLSRVMFDVVPLRLIPTILVGVIVYFMVGLSNDAARFFKFLLILVEFSLVMTLFNFILACVFRHGGVAILLSSLCNLFLMTYAGFFVNLGQIPPVLRWLRYFSTLGFMLEALSVNEVGSGLMIIDVLSGVSIEISAALIMETLFGFDLGNYYRDVLVLFGYIAGFSIILVGSVVYLLRESR